MSPLAVQFELIRLDALLGFLFTVFMLFGTLLYIGILTIYRPKFYYDKYGRLHYAYENIPSMYHELHI